MNQILTIQDTTDQIERLAAQREVYSRAKTRFFFQIFCSVFIPIAISVTSIFFPGVSPYSALYALVYFVIDSIFLEQPIKQLKTKAAKIQELFDCEVLELIKSPLKSPDDILLEEIQIDYQKHQKDSEKIKVLYGWYAQGAKEIADLPITIARLICQRESLTWDLQLRKLFYQTLLILSIALIIILGIIWYYTKLPFDRIVLILSGLLPLFRFSLKQYIDNKETSEKLNKTITFFNKTWERVLMSKVEETELNIISRQIQNEIYDGRTKNPLIPDFFYWLFKNRQEQLAKFSTERFVKQVKESKTNLLENSSV